MEDSERRKMTELLKEMRNNSDEVKSNFQEGGLKWMYKGPSDLIDREEYLLGKAIDKTFEELNSGGDLELIGRTGEQSNVPKRLLEKTDNTEQVDIAKKILEDPLYAIKQKEMEARKKLLNNPVKLKQIRQMLLERSKQNNAHRKQKRKKSEEQLNALIMKKLKKFSDKEKRKALKKIMKSESESSQSSSSEYKKKHKSHRKRSSSSGSTDSSSESSNSEDNKKNAKQKKRKKKEVEKRKRKSSSTSCSCNSSESSDSEIKKKKSRKKPKKHRKSDNSDKESSVDTDNKKEKKFRVERRNWESRKRSREKESRGRGKYGRGDVSEDRKRRKNYGLMMPDGTKPETKGRRSPVRRYEKKVETKTKYVPLPQSKPLSEKEREEKIKEMMKDAKLRKEDREKNLASHRKKELQEEESKAYDDDFMRRQMKHLTSQGTMADRIKSNINNIQRSESSMDSNFMRK